MLVYYRKTPIKNIFAHKIIICWLIFKIFAAHFTTNLVLNIVKKTFCLLGRNYKLSLKIDSQKSKSLH